MYLFDRSERTKSGYQVPKREIYFMMYRLSRILLESQPLSGGSSFHTYFEMVYVGKIELGQRCENGAAMTASRKQCPLFSKLETTVGLTDLSQISKYNVYLTNLCRGILPALDRIIHLSFLCLLTYIPITERLWYSNMPLQKKSSIVKSYRHDSKSRYGIEEENTYFLRAKKGCVIGIPDKSQ